MLGPWKKSYGKPRQCIKKQRHHFVDKGPSSQSYGFPIIMYECESWTIKEVKRRRMDAFWLWCWRRPAAVNLKGNQSWIFIGRADARAEAPILWTPDVKSLKKTLILGKIEGRRGREWQRMKWLHGITESMDISVSKLQKIDSEGQGSLACCRS